MVARGRAPDAAGGCEQGQGALLTRAILCPDRSRRRVCIAATYTRVAIKSAWVTFPEGGGHKEGFPDVGRDKPPLIPTGATVFWHLLCTRPQASVLHARSLMSSTTLQETPHLADEKLRLHGSVPCPDQASQLTGGRARIQAQGCPIPKKPTLLPSDPTQKRRREGARTYPLKMRVLPSHQGVLP